MLTTIRLLILGAFLCAPQSAFAIVNVLPTQQKAEGLSGNIKASMARRTGNTNLMQISGGSDVAFVTGVHATTLSVRADYGEKSDENISPKVFEHLRYRYGHSDWLTFEALLQHQYDAFKRLKFRVTYRRRNCSELIPKETLGLTLGE